MSPRLFRQRVEHRLGRGSGEAEIARTKIFAAADSLKLKMTF